MSFLFDNYLGEMICGGLSGLAFCVFGVFVLVMNARDRKKAQESMGWPSVEGKMEPRSVMYPRFFLITQLRAVHTQANGSNLEWNPVLTFVKKRRTS